MAGNAKPVPEGFHTLTPYLVVRDARNAIEFYKRAFGAEVLGIHDSPDGKVMNASLKIGNSIFMLNDEFPNMGACVAPQTLGGTTSMIHIYTDDVDSAFSRATSAGATVTQPVMDTFWGDRYGQLQDPYGHRWSLATHKEDLTAEEIEKRGKAVFEEMAKKARAGH